MRASVVLDASAAAAVVFLEPDAALVLRHLLTANAILVPPLFHYELANVGRTKARRGELSWARARRLLGGVAKWPLRVVEVPWARAFSLARENELTVYDAAYLALARSRRAVVLTLDAELSRAAGRRARGR